MTDLSLAVSQTKWCIDIIKSKTPSREISIVITTLETALNLIYAGTKIGHERIEELPIPNNFNETNRLGELGNVCFDAAMRLERHISYDNPGVYGKKYYILAYTRLMEASAWLYRI